MPNLKSTYRTHTCNELRSSDVGNEVRLAGWILRKRDHGGVVFVDLRDNYGVTQVVLHGALGEQIQEIRVESVIAVKGEVLSREKELINPKLETGEIEVGAKELEILSQSDVLPFQIAEDDNAPEATRLRYRFLELRREKLHRNIQLRNRAFAEVRNLMGEMGFLEFQTPILTSSSPEGARDYIVPSRLHPGKFFALPQAPQQFKQLLMVSGFDRYFQMAPCFRDEDARADRSPGEFYQIDMEMSFVEQEDVWAVNEELMSRLCAKFSDWKVTDKPFPRISYDECLEKYGSDKPDLRNPLEIQNVSTIFEGTGFKVFASAIEQGGVVACIPVALNSVPPRKYFDDAVAWFKDLSGQGLAYLSYDFTTGSGEVKGSIAKFFEAEELERLRAELAIDKTTSLFFAAGEKAKVLGHLGKLREKLAGDFDLKEKNAFRFCWITDYHQFELDEETGKVEFGHNPFSMPRGGLEALNNTPPLEIYADQYDLVCNGYELGSGAIRNHSPEVMYRAFEIAGYPKEVVDEKFGGMIRAFNFGAPPHGGIALGMDRIVMLLANESAIREVIPFPLAQTGEDLLMGAPGEIGEQQLKDVHIRVELPPETKRS